MTPFAVRKCVQAFSKGQEREQDLVLFAAYGNAALGHTDPKKFPKSFDDWIGRPKKPSPKMDDAMIFSNLKLWAKANAARN